MDEFDPNAVSADEVQSAADGKNQKLIYAALGVAAVGLLFGIAGMFMGNQASKKVQEMDVAIQELLARPDPSAEIKAAMTDIDSRLVTFGDQIVRLNNVDRQLQEGLRRSTEATGTELSTLRDALAETRTAVVDLNSVVSELRTTAATAPRASTAQATGTATAPATTADGMRIHVVRDGENPSRIASQYRVSVAAILQANPGLIPERMQVGQQIVIPAPAQ